MWCSVLASVSVHQEMTAASDREVREREHEFNLRTDEMRSELLSCELKVRRVMSAVPPVLSINTSEMNINTYAYSKCPTCVNIQDMYYKSK